MLLYYKYPLMFEHILYIQFHQMFLKMLDDRYWNFLNDLIDQLPIQKKGYRIVEEQINHMITTR
jgi:hypothetical protein